MKVAITGATGFLGSHLAEELVRRNVSVRFLLRKGISDTRWIDGLSGDPPLHIDYGRPDTLFEALKNCETVFHVAGLVSTPRISEFYEVNQRNTIRLLEAAIAAGVKRFVHISSQAAIGPSSGGAPARESDKPHPCNDYGMSKLLGEQEVTSRRDRIWSVVLRPPAIYGPRDRAFLQMYKMIRRGIIPLLGWGVNKFCIAHVSDVVSAAVLASGVAAPGGEPYPVPQRPSGEAYFVGDDTARTHEEVGRMIAAALGRRAVPFRIPAWALRIVGAAGSLAGSKQMNADKARLLLQDWTMDCSAFRNAFNWHPSVGLEAGLKETAEWYRKQGWLPAV